MQEIWDRARELMAGKCRVCPVCDGRRCPSGVPGMGGAGSGASFRANYDALARLRLNMRLIHDALDPDVSVELFGRRLAMPVLAAPVAGVAFNMTEAVSEEDYIRSVFEACREAGVLAGCGDGALDAVHRAGLRATRSVGATAVPFIKPWVETEVLERFQLFAQAGAEIGGLDIDAAGLITLTRMGKPVSPKTLAQHRRIIEKSPLKVILKGVMTPDDAERAAEAGAAGIVVSNHGGRVLEAAPGTAEVLPAIVRAVKGKLAVLVDGGVRSGADVLKMLALGADAVLIGRPLAIAAVGGGREGVARYLAQVKSELIQAMILTGCRDLAAIGPEVIFDPVR